MIRFLQRAYPDAELCVICTRPDVIEQTFGIPALKITRPEIVDPWLARLNRLLGRIPYKLAGPIRAYLLLRRFDAVIVPGTGALDDFGDTPFGMPYLFLKWMLAAHLRRCAVAFVSIGAGPAYHRLSPSFFAATLRCATYRSYRDEFSRGFVGALQIGTSRDRVFPDLAFGLPVPPMARRQTNAPLTIGLGAPRAGPDLFALATKLAPRTAWLPPLHRLWQGETGVRRVSEVLAEAMGLKHQQH